MICFYGLLKGYHSIFFFLKSKKLLYSNKQNQQKKKSLSFQVVAFLRQPNIIEILKERQSSVGNSRSLKDKINSIRVEGTIALERLGHDLQLTILLR
jgi:hypothetical protein